MLFATSFRCFGGSDRFLTSSNCATVLSSALADLDFLMASPPRKFSEAFGTLFNQRYCRYKVAQIGKQRNLDDLKVKLPKAGSSWADSQSVVSPGKIFLYRVIVL